VTEDASPLRFYGQAEAVMDTAAHTAAAGKH